MSKPVINLEAVAEAQREHQQGREKPTGTQTTKTTTSKREKLALVQRLFQKKEKAEGIKQDRTITFAKRPIENKLTLVFWGLFACIVIVLLMTFGRLDTMTHLAKAKAVDKTSLVTDVKADLNQLETMDYQGVSFVKALLTRKGDDEGNKQWEQAVLPYLAKGLSPMNLSFSQTNTEQTVQSVNFIKQEALHSDQGIYRLSYEVVYSVNHRPITLDISFPVSFQKDQIKVLASPSISNQTTVSNKNNAKVNEALLEVQGDPVSSDEQQSVSKFLDNFFDLYARNDEKLSMISYLQGLQGASFDSQSVKSIVKTDKEVLVVSGDYQVHFGEGNTINSPYQVTLKKEGQSYFVEKIN